MNDVEGTFKVLQRRFRGYPKSIRKEKLHWLFAEAVFHLKERFGVAVKRKDLFYAEVEKLRIVRLLLNSYLVGAQQFPSFDKHLYAEVKALPHSERVIATVDEIISQHHLESLHGALDKLKELVEVELLGQGLIKKKSDQEWIDLRPKHHVELEI